MDVENFKFVKLLTLIYKINDHQQVTCYFKTEKDKANYLEKYKKFEDGFKECLTLAVQVDESYYPLTEKIEFPA